MLRFTLYRKVVTNCEEGKSQVEIASTLENLRSNVEQFYKQYDERKGFKDNPNSSRKRKLY